MGKLVISMYPRYTGVYRDLQGFKGILSWDIWITIWMGDYMVSYHELYSPDVPDV